MRALAFVEMVLLGQRGHLFPWTPVCLGLGIGCWFMLRFEPGLAHYVAAGVLCAVAVAAALSRAGHLLGGWAALAWAVALVCFGFALAGARAHWVQAPVLEFRYYGPVEGRLVGLDRSAKDVVRMTLDQVRLDRVAPHRTPARVRLSLHVDEVPELRSGKRVMTTGHLSPPGGPAEPGGFDFRRFAWFQRLGGVGYTRNPVLESEPPGPGGIGLRILAVRLAASARVQAALPGDTGGFAAAVTTGDRSGISQDGLQALRDSNLAHLLAISGLHMGLLAGFVFALARLIVAAVPYVALRVPGHKVAALAALLAASGYLALSGRSIATERAFVMVAVMLLAVMTDRRALSLRSVAVAALIVLMLRPEALLGPGFQMSFAATTALVAVFTWMRDVPVWRAPGWLRPVIGLVVSSAVAGAATAPVAAAHFNVLAHFGLPANLMSVPLMGMVVIPAAVAALLLAPLGLEELGLMVMGWALDWILGVAHWAAGLPDAVGHVAQPGPWVLPVLALGALWVVLWQGRGRLAGIVPMALAFGLWAQTERPEVLVAQNGGLVGVMTPEGRGLSRAKGQGFVADIWLENDGEDVVQAVAAERWPAPAQSAPQRGQTRQRVYSTAAWEVVHLSGKRAVAAFEGCSAGQIVVASVPLDLEGACEQYGPKRLRETGSLAIINGQIIEARTVAGRRLWD